MCPLLEVSFAAEGKASQKCISTFGLGGLCFLLQESQSASGFQHFISEKKSRCNFLGSTTFNFHIGDCEQLFISSIFFQPFMTSGFVVGVLENEEKSRPNNNIF
jgi:hypothetical protein